MDEVIRHIDIIGDVVQGFWIQKVGLNYFDVGIRIFRDIESVFISDATDNLMFSIK
jgi:hypothetical protein